MLSLMVALGLSGCASIQETALPRPVSPPPTAPPPAPVPGGLLAGFGTRDITPPPGVGMSAFSADSRQAAGFRQRLYARAIVLEDDAGERVALVVVDLGMVSIVLHRVRLPGFDEDELWPTRSCRPMRCGPSWELGRNRFRWA